MKIRLLAVATLCILGYLKTFGQEANNVIEKAQAFSDVSVVLKPSWIKQPLMQIKKFITEKVRYIKLWALKSTKTTIIPDMQKWT